MIGVPTPETYRSWLCSLYGFMSAFEVKFAFTHQLEISFIIKRIKSGALSLELLALGLTHAEYPRLAARCEIPDFMHPLDGLGWLFVVDLVTLQHPALAQRCYGTEVEKRWTELGAQIDRWITGEADVQRCEAAARAALDCIEQWMTDTGASTVHVEQVQSA